MEHKLSRESAQPACCLESPPGRPARRAEASDENARARVENHLILVFRMPTHRDANITFDPGTGLVYEWTHYGLAMLDSGSGVHLTDEVTGSAEPRWARPRVSTVPSKQTVGCPDRSERPFSQARNTVMESS